MCALSLVSQNLLPGVGLSASRKPRVPPFDRTFHLPPGVRRQIQRRGVQRKHAGIRCTPSGGDYEQEILLRSRWYLASHQKIRGNLQN